MPGLERAKIPLHIHQVFIAVMDRLRVGLLHFEIAFHNITSIQLSGGLERRFIQG